MGLTPPLHCPDPSPLPPRPQGQGAGGGILPPPALRAHIGCTTGGSEPAAVAASLAKELGGVAGSPFSHHCLTLRPPRGFRENSGSLPTARAMGGVHRCPDPGSGPRGFLCGEGDHNHPLPARLQPAEQGIPEGQPLLAATESSRGRGAGPRAGCKKAPDPALAHQGGSGAPVLGHGRASSEVTCPRTPSPSVALRHQWVGGGGEGMLRQPLTHNPPA